MKADFKKYIKTWGKASSSDKLILLFGKLPVGLLCLSISKPNQKKKKERRQLKSFCFTLMALALFAESGNFPNLF